MIRKTVLLLLAGILCASLFACGGEDTGSGVSSAPDTAQSRQTISGIEVGETATSINIEATVTGIGKLADKKPAENGKIYYYVDITIKNIGTIFHEMSISQRFHLLDADRNKVTVESFTAQDGRDLNGGKLAAGESVTGRALFAVDDSFAVAAFTYTFDINGFGIFTYLVK